jgi:hypothetical protein
MPDHDSDPDTTGYFLQDFSPVEPRRLEAGRRIVLLVELMNDTRCLGCRIGLGLQFPTLAKAIGSYSTWKSTNFALFSMVILTFLRFLTD